MARKVNRNLNVKNPETKENWHRNNYNWKTANETEDPEILAKILMEGKDDWISRAAARNLNCHPKDLAKVLRRGKDKEDWVTMVAARNPNCPPEALSDVLKREKKDFISQCAVRNPNCSPKAILEWYEKTNQLTKYDPEKFELEHIGEDKDLEELKKLL